MELVIVDASVAAKWVLTEAQTGVAMELLHGPVRCAAPSIIRIEVGGAIIRRLRTGEMTPEDARAACDDWRDLVGDAFVRLLSTTDLYEAAVDLAFHTRHALPDCLYLAAARLLDCRLITADRTMHERGRMVHERIDLLAAAA